MSGRRDVYSHHALVDAHEIGSASKFAQAGSHALHRLMHTRFKIIRMQRVEKKQAAGDRSPAQVSR